jgi:peptidoglycan/LPS O-acetylase OafA/YrhL
MANQDDSIRTRLLSHLPEPSALAEYRKEVGSMLEKNQKRIRRERVIVTAMWVFCAIASVFYLWLDPYSSTTPKGPFLACFMFLWGMAELLKHYVNTCRIDLLKEIKQVQLQVLELHDLARTGRTG